MKRVVAAFLAGAVLASVGAAGAVNLRVFNLVAGDKARFRGLECSTGVQTYSYFSCVSSGRYGVVFGTKRVL